MNLRSTAVILALVVGNTAKASYPVDCQMRAIEIAVNAYETAPAKYERLFLLKSMTWADDVANTGYIISFKGSPITWTIPKKPACTLSVYVKGIAPNGPGCPYYRFDKFETQCDAP